MDQTTRPTDRPVSNLLFSFCASIIHHSFIIHSSYLLMMILIGRPIPLHPKAQPTRFAVRLTRRRRTGRKWTRFFSASVCRLHGGLHQDGSVLRLMGGKEGSSGSSKQVSKQVPSFKYQVQEDWSGVVSRTCPSSLEGIPRRQINGALYMPGGNVCNRRYTAVSTAESSDTYTMMSTPLSNMPFVSSRLVVYRWERLCFTRYLDT